MDTVIFTYFIGVGALIIILNFLITYAILPTKKLFFMLANKLKK